MSGINISAERVNQVEGVVKAYIDGFLKPLVNEADIDEFLSVYHPDVKWSDHAFLVTRVGHDAVLGLQKSFRHCNDPFDVKIKVCITLECQQVVADANRWQSIIPIATGAVLEQVWLGRSSNDIIRPDGQVAVKASGKDFVCHCCALIDIDTDGKITKIDEYYTKRWDDGTPQSEYKEIRGSSMRS